MLDEELVYAVALNKVFRYNPKISNFLLREFGSAKAIFSLNGTDLADMFKRRYSFFDELSDKGLLEWAEREIVWAK